MSHNLVFKSQYCSMLKIGIFVNSNIPDNITQSPLSENYLNIKYLYHESETLCVITCFNFTNIMQTFCTMEPIH